MKDFFDKALYFPFPNYSTRKMLFKTLVERCGGSLKENFPLSTLSYITEGYTAGSFKRAIEKVLTERRKAQITQRPLTMAEFIGPLSSTSTAYEHEYKETLKFSLAITGIEKKLKQKLEREEEAKSGKKGKSKSGKKGKKKKS